jgi:hypothetical protein
MSMNTTQVLREEPASQALVSLLHRFDDSSDVHRELAEQPQWHDRHVQPLDRSLYLDPPMRAGGRFFQDIVVPPIRLSTHWVSGLENRYQEAVETGFRTHAIAIGIFCVIVSMALFLSHPIPFAIGFLTATLMPILIRNLPERVGSLWDNSLDLIRGGVIATALATCPVSLAATAFFGGAGLSLCTQ